MGVGLRLAMSDRLGGSGGLIVCWRNGVNMPLYVFVKVHLDMLLTSWL